MEEGILESLRNINPNIQGIRKNGNDWSFVSGYTSQWKPIRLAPYEIRQFLRAVDKFEIEDFEEIETWHTH